MRKAILFGILLASLHGLHRAAGPAFRGAKKLAHVAYKVAV